MTTDREISNRRLIHALDYIDSKYIDEALGILTVPPRSGEYVRDRRRANKALAVFALRAACIMLLAGLIGSLPQILIGIIGPSQTSGPSHVDYPATDSSSITTDYLQSSEEEDTIDSPDYGEILYSNVSDDGVAYSFYDGAIVISFGDDENAPIPLDFDLPSAEVRKHYNEGDIVPFVINNGIINMKYEYPGNNKYLRWSVCSISYMGQTISVEDFHAHNPYLSLQAFEADGKFVVERAYDDQWTQAYILTQNSAYKVFPDTFDDVRFIYEGTPIYFYKGDDGTLRYRIRLYCQVLSRNNIIPMSNMFEGRFLTSRDQYYGEEGIVSITENGLEYIVLETLTVSDFFELCGTTIDEWFVEAYLTSYIATCNTLEELFEYNKKLMEEN